MYAITSKASAAELQLEVLVIPQVETALSMVRQQYLETRGGERASQGPNLKNWGSSQGFRCNGETAAGLVQKLI